MENTFTYAICDGTFEKGWSEEEAIAELHEVFGDYHPDECATVCDDCFEKIRPFQPKNHLTFGNATWESLGNGFIDYPEPDQTYGATD